MAKELFVDFALKSIGSTLDARDWAVYGASAGRQSRMLEESEYVKRSEGTTLRNTVSVLGDAGALAMLGWKRAGAAAVFSDVDVVVAAAFDEREVAGDRKIGLGLRLPVDNQNVEHGLRVVLESNGFLSFEREATAGGTATGIGRTSTGLTIEMGELYYIRAQLEGSTGRARAWKFTDPEPTTWLFEVTNANLDDFDEGYVGPVVLGTINGLHTDYLRFGASDDLEGGGAATERFERYLVDRR